MKKYNYPNENRKRGMIMIRYLFVIFIALTMTFFFSYCIPTTPYNPWTTQGSEIDTNTNTTTGNQDGTDNQEEAIDDEKSPYEMVVDTIATMTCAYHRNRDTFFLKLLVTNNGGVRIHNSFQE